jgi:hypothetical protein
MNNEAQRTRRAFNSAINRYANDKEGDEGNGQVEMEEQIGLSPDDASAPAPPEDCQPSPHPDNTACSSMDLDAVPRKVH